MKIIIAGSRDFGDYKLLKSMFLEYLGENSLSLENSENIEIVSGTASGADSLGEKLAAELGLLCRRMPADWEKYGKSAGIRRNAEMAKYADGLIAFWNGTSRGTGNMIQTAEKNGLSVKVVKY